ncbi:hypothetical protein EVG20_g3588 [Dentipellis fragilis]|uniref:Mitochondrial carrier n=1 Tax=Dentipellis fragilis TaxID=205917 RepID=A0A4Y9Z392_9AGAM|nr:hypothetical protein EVG20_g3588 [Dentipellis fragilis]
MWSWQLLSLVSEWTRLQCSPPGTYRGAVDCLLKTVRNESVFALYKGVTPPAVGWAAIDSVLLGSLHNYRLLLLRNGMSESVPGTDIKRLTLTAHGIAGLFAGLTRYDPAASRVVELAIVAKLGSRYPLGAAIAKLPSERQFKGPIDCARQVVRAHGVKGLWSALPASLIYRSNFFWMFLSFEALMRTFAGMEGTRFEMSTGHANFLSGGLCSLVYWIMAIPADNVKNRIMATPLDLQPPSFRTTVRNVYAVSGPKGFYAGLGTSLLRAFPSNACALFVYEGLMRFLGAEKTRH